MGSLYGYEVDSALPLKRLNRATGVRGVLSVETTTEPLFDRAGELAQRNEGPDGCLWFASSEIEEGCLLHLPPTCSFLLEPERSRIVVEVAESGGELLEHRLASSAICTLLAMRGDLALHASGVESEGAAVLLCGPTGRGKSTLVRALGELGHPVLGEDGIVVSLEAESPVAFPGARGVRIRNRDGEDIRTDLVPDPGPIEPRPSPLAAVVVLRERGVSLSVERLDPARALAMLISSLIHTGGRDSIAAAFDRLARLLHSVPAYETSLPDSLDALPKVAGELLRKVVGRG
jgi:hypothetical protein